MTPPQGTLSIARMCALTGVSRASYYRYWRQVAPGREQTALRDVLQRLAVAHRHYGYRRLHALLRREGWAVNHKRVLRLMRTDNLLCLRRRAFVPATTDSHHDWRVVPNLARGMHVTGLDQLWVADITYVRLLEEFAFLAMVLDAFSRRVVGWALELHLRAALAVAALQMALTARRPPPGQLIHHSDRYSALLAAHGIQPSMSRIGSPYDNAQAESFIFLDSGDGLVFKGDVGPWYAPVTGEFHLGRESARELVQIALRSYAEKHDGAVPKELFLHGRTRFNDEEWSGFRDAVTAATNIVGVRIRETNDLRVYRPKRHPVLRGLAYVRDERTAYVWTRGYVPRLGTYPGREVPKPLLVDICRGSVPIETVVADVLALTKVNYNSCKSADGVPVTLKFAEEVGEILTAGPVTDKVPPLQFKYYI